MVSTRQKILEHLGKYHVASIHEIGRALNLTPPDVFYHLQFLLQSGVVEHAPREASTVRQRGRPLKRYRLTHPVRAQNTAMLAKMLFDLFLSQQANAQERQLFLRQLAGKIILTRDDENPFNVRISTLVKHLTGIHYAARWEAHQDGPQVIFTNCPYHEVIGDCPELCEMDRFLLEEFLGAPVTTLQTYIDPEKSIRRCRFAVRKDY